MSQNGIAPKKRRDLSTLLLNNLYGDTGRLRNEGWGWVGVCMFLTMFYDYFIEDGLVINLFEGCLLCSIFYIFYWKEGKYVISVTKVRNYEILRFPISRTNIFWQKKKLADKSLLLNLHFLPSFTLTFPLIKNQTLKHPEMHPIKYKMFYLPPSVTLLHGWKFMWSNYQQFLCHFS